MSLTQLCPWPGSHRWGQLRRENFWLDDLGQGSLSKLVKRVRYHGSWAELISMASLTDSHKLYSADHDSQGGCEWISSLYIVVVVVQVLSRVQLFATPWTAVCQASLSFTISWSLLKLMSVESVMPSNNLILCLPNPKKLPRGQTRNLCKALLRPLLQQEKGERTIGSLAC